MARVKKSAQAVHPKNRIFLSRKEKSACDGKYVSCQTDYGHPDSKSTFAHRLLRRPYASERLDQLVLQARLVAADHGKLSQEDAENAFCFGVTRGPLSLQ